MSLSSDYQYHEGIHDVETTINDGASRVLFDDGSQVDMRTVSEDGATVAVRQGEEGPTVAVRLDWHAVQVLADELNALLRQARVNDWM